MKAVFDLDDTISRHRNRDFVNAEPILETIEKLRKLKADGWEICIYSARGQNSCKGDLRLIEERNRAQVEEWLKKYDVPYDELRFGKPLGDVYIDDKGMSLEEFDHCIFQKLHGNSGSEVYRCGETVLKTCRDAAKQAEWYKLAEIMGVRVPRVKSIVLNTLCMEYVPAYEPMKQKQLYNVIGTIMLFSLQKAGYRFDPEALLKRAEEHLETYDGLTEFRKLWRFVRGRDAEYREAASFCHGDLSISNIVITVDGPCLIDPICNENYNSYLMDFAKLRFSLDGGEAFLHGEEWQREKLGGMRQTLDTLLYQNGLLDKVKALEAIYWIRLLKYTEGQTKKRYVITRAKGLEMELGV